MGGVWERIIGIIRWIFDFMLLDYGFCSLINDVFMIFLLEVCFIINLCLLIFILLDFENLFILILLI